MHKTSTVLSTQLKSERNYSFFFLKLHKKRGTYFGRKLDSSSGRIYQLVGGKKNVRGPAVVQKKSWWHLHVDSDVRMSVKWGNHKSRDKIVGLHMRLGRWMKWWAVKDKSFYFQFGKGGEKASVKSRHPGQLEMGRASSTRVGVSYHLPGAPGSCHKLPLTGLISFGLSKPSFSTKDMEPFSFNRTSTENFMCKHVGTAR